MGFKCQNCGSNLRYDIENRDLRCDSCDSRFQLTNPDSNTTGNLSYGVYRCKSCGAELVGLPEEQTVYCSYCDTESFLTEKTQGIEVPQKIIPFSKTKEMVQKLYKEHLEKQLFLPKEFKEDSFINEFRGVYIPYWRTSVDIEEANLKLHGSKRYTIGNYDYVEKYDLEANIQGEVLTSLDDASVTFDDSIANCIAPFKTTGLRDFNPGYLAGFYSDKATVSNDIYFEAGKEKALNLIDKNLKVASGTEISSNNWKSKLAMESKSDGIALFPIWFLTWRNKKRVAYSVVNGQTGKLSTDLPVDFLAFFKAVGILTAILFIILNLLPIFVLPLRIAGLSSILLWISSYIFYKEISNIKHIEQHDLDYGFKGKIKKIKGNKILLIVRRTLMWAMIFIASCMALYAETPGDLNDACLFICFMQTLLTIVSFLNAIKIDNKLALAPICISLIICYISYGLANMYSPYDYVSFQIAFLCIAGLIINALFCLYFINYITTRPVPNFFTREGANNKYETN